MTAATIYLAFTDDWELKGDGSGDIRKIQFEPIRRLLSIYNSHNIRSTFMTEVMQQLTFRREQRRFPELGPLADEWDAHVADAYRQGHDIQLHIHPQWSDATYSDGKWDLRGAWSLSDYSYESTTQMVKSGKAYLEQLLRPIGATFRCRVFRAGASAIAPGRFVLPALIDHAIDLDISMIKGYRMKTRNLDIDFTSCAEGRLPYYPEIHDARQICGRQQPIVCMPLFQFKASRRALIGDIVSKVRKRVADRGETGSTYANTEWSSPDGSRIRQVFDKVLWPILHGKSVVADIGKLGARLLPELLRSARHAAKESGRASYPVVLSNHSKYVKDFDAIERFVDEVAGAPDVRCVTLSEMAEMIHDGRIPARTASL